MVWNLVDDLVALRMKQITRFVQKKIHSSCFQTATYAKWRSHKEKKLCSGAWGIDVWLYRTFSHVPRDSEGKCVCVCGYTGRSGGQRKIYKPPFANWTPNPQPRAHNVSERLTLVDSHRCTRLSTCGHGDVWNNIGNQHLNWNIGKQHWKQHLIKFGGIRRSCYHLRASRWWHAISRPFGTYFLGGWYV